MTLKINLMTATISALLIGQAAFADSFYLPAKASPACETSDGEDCVYVRFIETISLANIMARSQIVQFVEQNGYSQTYAESSFEVERGYLFKVGSLRNLFVKGPYIANSIEMRTSDVEGWMLAEDQAEIWALPSNMSCLDTAGGTVCQVFRQGDQFISASLSDWDTVEKMISRNPGLDEFIRDGTFTVNLMATLIE